MNGIAYCSYYNITYIHTPFTKISHKGNAFNFILHDSLGGGGSGSLLNDAQGKTHGQLLLLLELDVPETFNDYLYSLDGQHIIRK